jgi:hypothetical protein
MQHQPSHEMKNPSKESVRKMPTATTVPKVGISKVDDSNYRDAGGSEEYGMPALTLGPQKEPVLEVIDQLIRSSGDDTALISQFASRMVALGYTRDEAIAHLHEQIAEGTVALTNSFEIVRR